ncbi:VOC family protein [Nonomuraea basaltis]|uniref:VOC family protein n=1 Tax=Nonomuraea basaltis TaxID=2495887 RepID=UPI00110C6A81|nr:VOC family protein [Nonomuraea basaltis]TMR96159.1 VOC family protein [Nonomuraea basaltis]
MARANLLVIYTARIEECRAFYASLGLDFRAEQHRDGPTHYAATLGDGLVVEFYPATGCGETGALRLGFEVAALPDHPPGRRVLRDPDGRAVEVRVRG